MHHASAAGGRVAGHGFAEGGKRRRRRGASGPPLYASSIFAVVNAVEAGAQAPAEAVINLNHSLLGSGGRRSGATLRREAPQLRRQNQAVVYRASLSNRKPKGAYPGSRGQAG